MFEISKLLHATPVVSQVVVLVVTAIAARRVAAVMLLVVLVGLRCSTCCAARCVSLLELPWVPVRVCVVTAVAIKIALLFLMLLNALG